MLNPAKLESDILSLTEALDNQTDLPAGRKAFAKQLSVLIDNYVRSATVLIPPAAIQIVAGGTAGSNPAPVHGTLT